MIAISPRSVGRNSGTISFASTLYLCPILDLLLAEVPVEWRLEIRLGLQEALVNAAKHGNKLDPSKVVLVRFSVIDNQYWWIISDQGSGFPHASPCGQGGQGAQRSSGYSHGLPCHEQECGRGMYILHQIFDQVQWNLDGTELRLCKILMPRFRMPLFS